MTRIGLDKHGWVVPLLCNNSQFYRFEPVLLPETLLSKSLWEAGSSHSCSSELLQPGQGHCSLLQSVSADLASPSSLPLNAQALAGLPHGSKCV